MASMIGRIDEIAHHRNGVNGEPFTAVKFTDPLGEHFIAIVHEQPGFCSVLSTDRPTIAFGRNSWRGDQFEPELRRAIEEWNEQAMERYAAADRA